jgi:hypothetical protein
MTQLLLPRFTKSSRNPNKHPSGLRWKSVDDFKKYVDSLPFDTFFYNRAKGQLSDGLSPFCKHHDFSLAEVSECMDYMVARAKTKGMYTIPIRGNRVFTRNY